MFSEKYLRMCKERAKMISNKTVKVGDWYIDTKKMTMNVVSLASPSRAAFPAPRFIYVPDTDDLLEILDNQVSVTGCKPEDKGLKIEYLLKDKKWRIEVRYSGWITWGGGESVHEALLNCLYQMAAVMAMKRMEGVSGKQIGANKQEGEKSNAKDADEVIDLIRAAWQGRIIEVEDLLLKGANVNAKEKDGLTALMAASTKGHTDIVRVLLDKGADVSAKHVDGGTVLVFASWQGHADVVKILLEKGADVNERDGKGRTALMLAQQRGHAKVVRLLKCAADGPSESLVSEKLERFKKHVVSVIRELTGGLVETNRKSGRGKKVEKTRFERTS